MSTPRASNADQPPQKDDHPLPLSFLSLPEEIVLSCLARVPRNCYLNLSMVSKTLRSLVRSSELKRSRSLLPKKSIYINFYAGNKSHWLTLRSIEKTTTTIGYQLVPIPFFSHKVVDGCSTVTVGSEIYYLVRSMKSPCCDLWILDTRSGKFTQGPSIKVKLDSADIVGVLDGKIWMMGIVAWPDEKIQVEVFDPKSKIWKSVGQEKVPPRPWCPRYASLEGKIYMVECGRTSVYNPREGEGKRMVHMTSERLVEYDNPREGIRKELDEVVHHVCVVEDVLYTCFDGIGLMWFDTKLNVWRRLVLRDWKEVCGFDLVAMAEYEGKLAVFKSLDRFDQSDNCTKRYRIKMFMFALHRVGERICGTIEWSAIVAAIPCPVFKCIV